MIRMIQSNSAGHAKSYYGQALLKADYYMEDQELNGRFQGRLSERLGITGIATRERFHALCENRHPETGLPLTPRTRTDRKVGYDINFHVPKSVSILHALAKDGHILEAFQDSMAATMKDIEAEARTRVRKDGIYDDRKTGELLWVDFIHQTARPVDGYAPDPHLHAHCFVFNLTFDAEENKLKAGKFRQINKDMPYFQALFHKRLADNLLKLGYQIRPTAKSFEVAGVPQEVIDLFSKRSDEIGRVAKEKGITDAKELSGLGARTRAKKQTGLSMTELKAEWRNQIIELQPEIKDEENLPVRFGQGGERTIELTDVSLQQCVDYTISHCFERTSVMDFSKLAGTAIKFGIGKPVTAEAIIDGLQKDTRIIYVEENNILLCTTKEVLKEEHRMVQLANEGRGKFAPLYVGLPDIQAKGQQGDAIRHVLTSPDMVAIIRGGAGAGKTTLMREAVALIEKAGKQVIVVAPTSQASRGVLRQEGFEKAETVALFLTDTKMQERIKGQVLWVDEAGMLGTQEMKALLEITTEQQARLILGGDTRQHAAVVRGDALRVLNTVGGIQTAEVSKIFRQKEAVYRSAVADIASGAIREGFDKLDGIGAIKGMSASTGYDELANDYLLSLKEGKEVLVICPTHAQGEAVTAALRSRLKTAGLLGRKEIEVQRLRSLNLTNAQKTDWRNLKPAQIVQFNQNDTGIKRGSVWEVAQSADDKVMLTNGAKEKRQLPLDKPGHFDVYESVALSLAKGDKVQITKNSFDKEKKRLNNGQVLDVVSVTVNGDVLLTNSTGKAIFKIEKNFGHLSHAHCITSYAAQGKTVDEIFIAQSAATFPATNARQFYVSVSRAREKVNIYTDDKQTLLYRAAESADRQAALELVDIDTLQEEHIAQIQQDAIKHIGIERDKANSPAKGNEIDRSPNYDGHEPGL